MFLVLCLVLFSPHNHYVLNNLFHIFKDMEKIKENREKDFFSIKYVGYVGFTRFSRKYKILRPV